MLRAWLATNEYWVRAGLFTDLRLSGWIVLAQAASHACGGPVWPWLFGASVGVFLVGLLFGIAFAQYAVLHIFNRQMPDSLVGRAYTTWQLLLITHPLESLWRLITCPFRALPDMCIVGEVRCGTTSLAAILKENMDLRGPFTPWVHPVLAGKESFYFSGHYFGFVHPYCYRMCFPTVFEQWLYRFRTGRRMLIFDGCAQYLSSPWCSRLLWRANNDIKIIACTREPSSQNVSWWNYETRAQAWADALGMPQSAPMHRVRYPPSTLAEGFALSQSGDVTGMFEKAEKIKGPFLPAWAVPTINGQLSSFSQMSMYARNVRRYVRLFGRKNVFVADVTQVSEDPKPMVMRIRAALGLPTDVPSGRPRSDSFERKMNPKKKRLNSLGTTDSDVKRHERGFGPESLRKIRAFHAREAKAFAKLLVDELGFRTSDVPDWCSIGALGGGDGSGDGGDGDA